MHQTHPQTLNKVKFQVGPHGWNPSSKDMGWWFTGLVACCAPALLAYSVSPSATFLNQAAAVLGWALFLFTVLIGLPSSFRGKKFKLLPAPAPAPLLLALALLILSIAMCGLFRGLPSSLALSSMLMLMAALCAGLTGMAASASGQRVAAFEALAFGMAGAGALAVLVGVVQVFAPDWSDGRWVAVSALEGRATGNLRQPNHLGSLLVWGIVAFVALGEIHRTQPTQVLPFGDPQATPAAHWGRLCVRWALVAWMVLGIVLSASRTAALGVVLLFAWGLLDSRLSRGGRILLGATPALYALIWASLTAWADATGHAFGGEARFSMQGDVSSSRFGVWANTLALIGQHPWAGVGWGNFNFAWSLTPFPDRPTAFFDHTHNLALQLGVEMGLPLAAAVLGLLAWALSRVGVAAWRMTPGPDSVVLRSGLLMLLAIALHSLLEYPLWYAYFLLPTVFIWGLCLGRGSEAPPPSLSESSAGAPRGGIDATVLNVLRAGALLMAIGGAAAVVDYWRVVVIFAPPAGAAPLAERIETGERSLLFSHHAHYAAATTATGAEDATPETFRVTTHHLLDTRLMIAWAKALNARGDVERARHLAARLREFHNPNSDAFFEPCEKLPPQGDVEPLPFQCTPPTRRMDWRDFR